MVSKNVQNQPLEELKKIWEEYGRATYDWDEMENLYYAAVESTQNGAVVEIGTYGGCSAAALLMAGRQRELRIHLCDPHAWMWSEDQEKRLRKTLDMFRDVRKNVHVKYSQQLAAEWPKEMPVEMVHIDGNHQADGVASDCKFWLPKLKKGGIAAFHDVDGIKDRGLPEPFVGMKTEIDLATKGWEKIWHGGWFGLLILRKP